jgi:carbon monoxide dehydrogenase subunit G
MILEGQFTLRAPIQKVWDSLLNPEVLASCVPGCEKLEIIDDRTYASIVAAKVGSISARFRFTTKLTEVDPPRHLKATGGGDELGKAATFTQETVIDLAEISGNDVQVSYRSNVNIVGKLATFGDRIMKAKAAQVQEQFTQSLGQRLSMGLAAAGQSLSANAAGQSAGAAATDQSAPLTTTDQRGAPGTPALKVTLWEMIAVFFGVLWDKVKSISRRSRT